jgi:hypothetical protein
MKQHLKFGSYLLAGMAGMAMLVPTARAQFAQTQDVTLFLGFRNAGANDYVVNIGTIGSYLAQGPGTINVSSYNASDLSTFMGGFNSLTLSVFGTQNSDELILSRARTTLGTQTTPWARGISGLQGNVASKINSIGNEAQSYGESISPAANNTATAIVEPDSAFVGQPRFSYSEVIGSGGNFGGSFSGGNIEGTTGTSFSSGGTPLRLDLYDVVAGSGPSTFVGFFDFNPNGTTTFTVVPEAGTLAAGVALLMLFAATQRRRLQRAMGLTK